MIPDGFQYFLDHSGNFENATKYGPWPLIYYKTTSNIYKKNMETFHNTFSVNMGTDL